MLLGNFSSIATGLVLSRKKYKKTDNASDIIEYKVLTLKSFEDDGYIDTKALDFFESTEKLNEQYLTKDGDIVIRLTTPFTAVSIHKKHEGFVISSNFAIIRLKTNTNKFIAGYVSLFLNSEELKKQFNRSSRGTAIPVIKVTDLKDIDIKEIPLDLQNKLFQINKIFSKEKFLLKKMIVEKNELKKSILKKFIGE